MIGSWWDGKRNYRRCETSLDGTNIVSNRQRQRWRRQKSSALELCRTLPSEIPGVEVLCLNPHRADDDFSFAFLGNPPIRVIVGMTRIALNKFRYNSSPLWLKMQKTGSSKIHSSNPAQALRPFHTSSMKQDLGDKLAPQISLSSLKKSQVKALAAEALGPDLVDLAGDLAGLTTDSPFSRSLPVELLRQRHLKWGKWVSDDEFRRHVLSENLNIEISNPSLNRIEKCPKDFCACWHCSHRRRLDPEFYRTAARCRAVPCLHSNPIWSACGKANWLPVVTTECVLCPTCSPIF